MKKLYLIFSLFCVSLLFSDEIISLDGLLNKAAVNHSSWINLERSRENVKLNNMLLKESLIPDFTFGDGATPVYTVGSSKEKYYHNIALVSQMNWWLPTDGILSVAASDTFSFIETDDNYVIGQSPLLSFSYSQPTWLKGKIFEPSLYKKMYKLQMEIPLNEEKIKYLIERNRLILDAVKELLELKFTQRTILLLETQFNLAEDELEVIKLNRDKGIVSGTDYWKKQLERDSLQDSLWEKKSNFKVNLNSFLSNYGYKNNFDTNDLSISELPKLPTAPLDDDISSSLLLLLKEIELEKTELESSLLRKEYASNLTTSFTIAPQYGIRDKTSSFFDSFNFKTENNYIDYSLSVTLKLSSKNFKEQKIHSEIIKLNNETARLVYDDAVRKQRVDTQLLADQYQILLERKKRIESSIKYAETLYIGEEKLIGIGRSTTLLLKQVKFNYESRKNELDNLEEEIYLVNLKILTARGYDLMLLLNK